MQKQLAFAGFKKPKDSFGGSLLKNSNAKTNRPLESKLPLHLVLRSTKCELRQPKNFKNVNQTVKRVCAKHGITVYDYENMGNHLHVLVKVPSVRRWPAFIRELIGQIAQIAQGISEKQKGSGKFWRYRPFTRIVRGWKRAFKVAKEYIELNRLEIFGYIKRADTKTLKDLRAIWGDG